MSEKEMNDFFTARLKELLNNRDMTYKELSMKLNIKPSTISMWNSGRSLPRMEMIERIAKYFGVSPAYLMGWEENYKFRDTPNTKRDERDIAKTVNDLMGKLESNDGAPLFFDGAEMSEETKILFEQQLKSLVTTVKKINKAKFNPKHTKNTDTEA